MNNAVLAIYMVDEVGRISDECTVFQVFSLEKGFLVVLEKLNC